MTKQNAQNKSPDDDRFIDLDKITARQRWGVRHLSQVFYEAGRFFEKSEKRTVDASLELYDRGYEDDEIKPIVDHFNATTAMIEDKPAEIKSTAINAIRTSILQGWLPPNPPPKP